MDTTSWWRAAAPWALVITLSLGLGGCGGYGHHHHYVPAGTLEVENDASSFWGLDAVEISVPFGPVDHYDLFLAPGEFDWIDLIPDTYDIDLLWEDGTVQTFWAVDIWDGETTNVTGVN